MKAIIMKDKVKPGSDKAPLYYEDVPIPEPGEGEVLIKMKFAALNRRDIFLRYGLYPGIKVPAIPGSDGSGVIAELGKGVSHFSLGDEVIINPALEWGDNPAYPTEKFSILGVPVDGTYAQYLKISAENVFKKPAHLSLKEAAAIPLGGLTAYRALVSQGNVRKGDTVIIPGIGGGVATIALQIAIAKGAEVYVTSSDDEKIAKAVEMGAAGGVNYRNDDWVKQLKQMSGGADLSIDSVGGETFNALIDLAKPGSKLVSFGATTGPVNKVVMPKIFFKQMSIIGSTMGNNDEFAAMVQLYEEKQLRPLIDAEYDLANLDQAHQQMENGRLFGKIVIAIPE